MDVCWTTEKGKVCLNGSWWKANTENGRLHRNKYPYGIAETRIAIVMMEGIGKWPFALMGT